MFLFILNYYLESIYNLKNLLNYLINLKLSRFLALDKVSLISYYAIQVLFIVI